ncbi:response regulator transcription factor [Cohnella nanjingensis]|uniref:Response regulator transcription factor n=1 Tax=Cohnella nanjingensis TaxID=1387779 RepID=A0A7X0RP46_9BACL|nr:response regulator transcription factor [Cohnella nanjingensis]MBB6669810.1 response regulator transcription factor [Cohnella nanjingensis]
MNRIRLLLVEDDPDWIKAMSAFLNREEDLLIVGAATNAEEALQLARTLDFDVVLMDVHLSETGRDGIYAAMEMLEIRPMRVVMLTSDTDEKTMTDAFTAGAVQYLEKSRYRELPHAIRGVYHHPGAMEALLKEFARLKREEQLKPLTPAEREVYEMIERGYTHPQIEKRLYKAESTLKNQVNKILKKLQVRSGKEAVDKVRRKGLAADRHEKRGETRNDE